MTPPEPYIQGNKEAWEEAFEQRSPEWGLDILPRLQSERYPFFSPEVVAELEPLDWTGKAVAQFCCNNGRELLSLMKQGAAEGTGFDLAANQVEFANRTAQALRLNCTFVAANILDIPARYDDRFDFLLITIGSLCWFQDLSLFFEKVARCLRQRGTVLIHEQHPMTNLFALPGESNYDAQRPAAIVNSYFANTWTENEGMPYITRRHYPSKTFTSYTHPLSAVFSAAIAAGLRVTAFREFERDLGGEFSAIENRGVPLSFLLVLKK